MSSSRNLPITQARVNLGAVVERVRTTGERVTLEKGGIPVATLVNTEELEDMQDALDLLIAREENREATLIDWKKVRAQYA
jgi:prevent-host-death family protein